MAQRIIDRGQVGEVLQQIYASRLNLSLTISSEEGYFYIVYESRKSSLRGITIEEAVTHLALVISEEFPQSQFASWWYMNFQQDDRFETKQPHGTY